MNEYTDTELQLAAQIGALRHACECALNLLENTDSEAQDANRVEKLLFNVLNANFPMPQSGHFVAGVETVEAGGNCPIDLIHLHNGLVIGVDSETAVLYQDENDVFDYEAVNRPNFSVFRG